MHKKVIDCDATDIRGTTWESFVPRLAEIGSTMKIQSNFENNAKELAEPYLKWFEDGIISNEFASQSLKNNDPQTSVT